MTEAALNELEAYFKSIELPKELRISRAFFIPGVALHLELELEYCRHTLDRPMLCSPPYERLVQLKEILSQQNN